jgi:hypothetical protein
MSLKDELLEPWRKLPQIILLYAVAGILGGAIGTVFTVYLAYHHGMRCQKVTEEIHVCRVTIDGMTWVQQ